MKARKPGKKEGVDSGPSQAADFRQAAERRLRNKKATPIEDMAEVDVRALLHELQVHQIELEMQNEQLLRAQTVAQEASDRYQDLFDFAPTGNFRLDAQGRILEVNLAGAALLGLDRNAAVGKRFGQFTAIEHRAAFAEFCRQAAATAQKQTCEIEILRGEQRAHAMLEGITARDGGGDHSLRVTVTDITERKKAEDALRRSEERLRAQYQGLPVPTYTWQWVGDDFVLADYNEAAVAITEGKIVGLRGEKARNQFADRPDIQEELARCFAEKAGIEREMAYHFKSSGKIKHVAVKYSFVPPDLVLVHTEDITGRKQAEEIMRARLRLLEHSTTHPLEDLLVATLDEAEALTGSQIGFYHFLEADQLTVSLQAWSTRTVRQSCTAEGKGRHYDVSDAGVWVDCIRERRPVIHNSYAALPHRKGMPPGHASVVRELVVPVMRGEQIVALLGVGNKPTDYNDDDVHAVARLADLAWDIVERKRAEQALRESEARYRLISENAADVIWVLDPVAGKFTYVSPSVERQRGYTAAEVMARPLSEAMTPESAELVNRLLAERLPALIGRGEGTESHVAEVDVPRKDGSIVHTEVTVTGIFDDHGQVQIVGVSRDITERKRAEEALRDSEEKFRVIFEQAPDSFVLIDAGSGEITAFNQRAHELLGYTAEEFRKLRIADLEAVESPAQVAAHTSAVLKAGYDSFETRHRAKDGQLRDVLVSAHVITVGGKRFLASIFTDVTERKLAESERELMIEVYRLINQADDRHALLRAVADLVHTWAGCDAVGIRLREGDDFPYFETRGFPPEFVLAENRLCAVDAGGELRRDSQGNPVVECMCGNILCGRFDPSKPFFTPHGSFWTNSTSELLASTTEADRQARTRNRCNGEGYESVALVPLRAAGETFGLIQVNDRRKGRFTPQSIALFERLADTVALGFANQKAEQLLRESEERFRQLANNVPEMFWVVSPDWKAVEYVSPAYERLTGLSCESLLSSPASWLQTVHPEDRERVREAILGYDPKENEPLVLPEARVVHQDGSIRWTQTKGFPIRNREGQVFRVAGITADITERKRLEDEQRETERKLLESEYFFRESQRAGSIGSYRADFTSDRWESSEVLDQIFGIDRNYVRSVQGWLEIVHPDDREMMGRYLREEVISGRKPFNKEYRIVRKSDGAVRWLNGSGEVGLDKEGNVVSLIGTIQDITARKRMEEALWESRRRQAEAEKLAATGRMAAMVAHEINNPLAGIKNAFRLVRDAVPVDHPDRDMAERIDREIARISHIVQQMYQIYSPRTEKPTDVPVGATVRDVLTLLEPLRRERQVTVDAGAVAPDLTVRAHAGSLQQVLYNLAVNAIQASPCAGVVRVAAEIVDETWVKISVADQGPGIPAEIRSRIFEPFVTSDTSVTPKHGLGLGLAVVKGIVDALGGRVEFDTVAGKGTCFRMHLPSARPKPE